MEVALNNPTNFGRLYVTGGAVLGGPLLVAVTNAFVTVSNYQFQILSCSNVTGAFYPVALPPGAAIVYNTSTSGFRSPNQGDAAPLELKNSGGATEIPRRRR